MRRATPAGQAVIVTAESRYFALLYASAAERAALDALFGIEREVLDSMRPGLDHHVAHSRLQWWREECERAARGGAVHPLTRALIASLGDPQAKSVPQVSGLCGIVDVAIWDLASATFETRREVEAYCQRWAAAMIEPLVGAALPSPLPVARASEAALLASAERTAAWHALGAAICEIELLAALARDANVGRIRLPLDELEKAGADPTALAKPPWPEALATSIRARLTSLRGEIERSVAGLDREQQQALRGLLVWAALSWRTAERVERALPDRVQPGRFDAIGDAWFAWRVARRATVGRFRLN
jgi:phytoene synthase